MREIAQFTYNLILTLNAFLMPVSSILLLRGSVTGFRTNGIIPGSLSD